MNIEKRVAAIQAARQMTVGEVLALLKISSPMWSMIRARERDPTGKAGRSPSIKTMRRIEQAEIEAGLRGGRSVRDSPVDYGASVVRRVEMLAEMGGIKKELDALSRRVDDFIKRHE